MTDIVLQTGHIAIRMFTKGQEVDVSQLTQNSPLPLKLKGTPIQLVITNVSSFMGKLVVLENGSSIVATPTTGNTETGFVIRPHSTLKVHTHFSFNIPGAHLCLPKQPGDSLTLRFFTGGSVKGHSVTSLCVEPRTCGPFGFGFFMTSRLGYKMCTFSSHQAPMHTLVIAAGVL